MGTGLFNLFALLCISAALAVPVPHAEVEEYGLKNFDEARSFALIRVAAIDDAEAKIKAVLGDMFVEAEDGVKDIEQRKDDILEVLDRISDETTNNLDKLKDQVNNIDKVGYGIVEHFKETLDIISKDVLESVNQIVDVAIKLGEKTLERIFKHMKEIAIDSTKLAEEAAKRLRETLMDSERSLRDDAEEIKGWIQRDMQSTKKKLEASLEEVKGDANKAVKEVREIILDLIEKVKDNVKKSLFNIKGTSGVLLRSVLSIADEASRDFRDDVKEKLLAEVKEKTQDILNEGNKHLENGKEKAKVIQEKIAEIAEQVKEKAIQVTEKVKETIRKVVDGVKETVEAAGKKLVEIREKIAGAFRKFFGGKYIAYVPAYNHDKIH